EAELEDAVVSHRQGQDECDAPSPAVEAGNPARARDRQLAEDPGGGGELQACECKRSGRKPRFEMQCVAEEEPVPAARIGTGRDRLLAREQAYAERDEGEAEQGHDEP